VFCAKCGQQIPESSDICPLCGREATFKMGSLPTVPAFGSVPAPGEIIWPDKSQKISLPAGRPGMKRIGGWLLFFCIMLTVLAPITVLIQAWTGDIGAEGLFEVAWAAFGALVGVMTWNVNPRAFLLLWIYFGITLGFLVLGFVGMALSDDSASFNQIMLTFRTLIYTVAWFIYFKRSDRVRATFGRNL
jgi:hypothetical protein